MPIAAATVNILYSSCFPGHDMTIGPVMSLSVVMKAPASTIATAPTSPRMILKILMIREA